MSRGPELRVLLISPYHGGSHAAWAEGLQRHSNHTFELLTLPDRFWKWRMHGGATTLARRFVESPWRPDVIVATDMLDLTTFLAMTRSVTADVPVLLYMHENQLTYPLPADGDTGPMRRQLGERDHHYAFVNFASMLAADRVAFNSGYHRDAWFAELPRFLRHFPEHNELSSVSALRDRSLVLPVGIDCPEIRPGTQPAVGPETDAGAQPAVGPETDAGAQQETDAADQQEADAVDRSSVDGAGRPAAETGRPPEGGASTEKPPLVIWNQRWEYDKNPEQMIRALREVAARAVPFRLAICGQTFSSSPTPLEDAPAAFGERLVHFGFADPADYHRLLDEALLTLSTADHEFFGVAVLEAMSRGTFALLPDRLAYPELLSGPELGEATRRRCLYGSHDELVDGLCQALREPDATRHMGAELAHQALRFDWRRVSTRYDRILEDLVSAGPLQAAPWKTSDRRD